MSDNVQFELPPLRIRRTVRATLVVVGVAAGFFLLYLFHNALVLLFLAIVISTAMKPVVYRLHERGLSRGTGVALVYLGLLLLLVGLIVLGAPVVIEQSTRIARALPAAYADIREAMLGQPNLFIYRLGLELPEELRIFGEPAPNSVTEEEIVTMLQQAWEYLGTVAMGLFGIFATLAMAFYWTLNGERIIRASLLVLQAERREEARAVVEEIETRLGQYTRGMVILMLSIAAMTLVAYLLIGVPYAVVLALFAGLMEAVPLIGPGLGAIPAAVIAFSDEPTKALWVLIATLVIQQIENNYLVPRVMNRQIGINALVTLLAFAALTLLLGPPGALIAVPAGAIIQMLLGRYLLEPDATVEKQVTGRDHVSVLRYGTQELIGDMRRRARQNADEIGDDALVVEDHLEAIALDLDSLLASYEDRVGAQGGPKDRAQTSTNEGQSEEESQV